jgi:hypothetical protein
VPGHLLEITEYLRLRHVSGVIPQFEPREAERLHDEHGRTVADPAEKGGLALPPSCGVLGDRDHGKVRAVGPLRVGPPSLGLHVDLAVQADVQPHMHDASSRHDMRRGEHSTRRNQIPRPTRAITAWPPVNRDLSYSPRLNQRASP